MTIVIRRFNQVHWRVTFIVMLLAGAQHLREVALFPMNQQANDLLMGAPSEVSPKQLRELSIRVVAPEKK